MPGPRKVVLAPQDFPRTTAWPVRSRRGVGHAGHGHAGHGHARLMAPCQSPAYLLPRAVSLFEVGEAGPKYAFSCPERTSRKHVVTYLPGAYRLWR
jgi:hypothetical protein